MSRNERLYLGIGEAIHLAQGLELQLRLIISILKQEFDVDIDADGLILRDDKQTLGALIAELKKHGELDDGGSAILADALAKRNYIAHHFFNRNVAAFTDDTRLEAAIGRLTEDTRTIAKATAMTTGFVEALSKAFNLKRSEILVRQDA